MAASQISKVRCACADFLEAASHFYQVPNCSVRVLAARPLNVREQWTVELFGHYAPETMVIRVWMRTAVRNKITSFGTFLSTLCHEFCHPLDYQKFDFADSWHTRGFYERAPCFTIMRGARRGSAYSGCHYGHRSWCDFGIYLPGYSEKGRESALSTVGA